MAIDRQSEVEAQLTKMAERTSKVQTALQAEKQARSLSESAVTPRAVSIERAPVSPLTESKR